MNIRDLERQIDQAEKRANAWGISERLRERRLAEVAELRAQLAEAYATR